MTPEVKIGDLFEYKSDSRFKGYIFKVVSANVGTELGSDSWVMKIIGDRRKTLYYMNHKAMIFGDWVLVVRDGHIIKDTDYVRLVLVQQLIEE